MSPHGLMVPFVQSSPHPPHLRPLDNVAASAAALNYKRASDKPLSSSS